MTIYKQLAAGQWQNIEKMAYKAQGSAPFARISRQILMPDAQLDCQLRYFEIAAGGFSTLERHEHEHGVMVVRGHGRCLLDRSVHTLACHDVVHIPSMTWHQFRADDVALGFLCVVNQTRDRPQLPDDSALAYLRAEASVAAFIKTSDQS